MRAIFKLLVVLTLSLLPVGAHADGSVAPHNRIAIIIDASGSYQAREADAIERATALIDEIADAKLGRWEKAMDEVAVISLDAVPEVLLRASVGGLKAMDRRQWLERIRARRDYAFCTDVTRAFEIASLFLTQGDTRYVTQYLVAFSDMQHEPPGTSIRGCQKTGRVPNDFPWEVLKHTNVSVMWMPAEAKLQWARAATAQGASTFAFYTESESSAVHLARPPKAKLDPALSEELATAD